MIRRLWSVVVFTISFLPLVAQQHEQLWLDFQVDYPFANKYLLEVSPSYQTVLSKENKWRSASLSATFEYVLFRQIDLTVEVPVAVGVPLITPVVVFNVNPAGKPVAPKLVVRAVPLTVAVMVLVPAVVPNVIEH